MTPLRRVLEALARTKPLVLVLDDVHWGQPTYLDLVEQLVEWVRDAPMLLVAFARPELRELRDALASGRRALDVIELDPLGAADSRTLVDELLGDRHSAARIGGRGHAADGGGGMEYDAIPVATLRDGRLVRDEIFDAGDEAGALARLAEIRAV